MGTEGILNSGRKETLQTEGSVERPSTDRLSKEAGMQKMKNERDKSIRKKTSHKKRRLGKEKRNYLCCYPTLYH